MSPGELCRWSGNELFSEPRMGLSNYQCTCKAGGLALVVATDSYEDQDEDGDEIVDFTQEMALVIIKDMLGWTPTNWLEPVK